MVPARSRNPSLNIGARGKLKGGQKPSLRTLEPNSSQLSRLVRARVDADPPRPEPWLISYRMSVHDTEIARLIGAEKRLPDPTEVRNFLVMNVNVRPYAGMNKQVITNNYLVFKNSKEIKVIFWYRFMQTFKKFIKMKTVVFIGVFEV